MKTKALFLLMAVTVGIFIASFVFAQEKAPISEDILSYYDQWDNVLWDTGHKENAWALLSRNILMTKNQLSALPLIGRTRTIGTPKPFFPAPVAETAAVKPAATLSRPADEPQGKMLTLAIDYFTKIINPNEINLDSSQTNQDGTIAFNFKLEDSSIIEVDVNPVTCIATIDKDITDAAINMREEVYLSFKLLNTNNVYINGMKRDSEDSVNGVYHFSVSTPDFNLTYDYNPADSAFVYKLTSLVNKTTGQDLYKTATDFLTYLVNPDDNFKSWTASGDVSTIEFTFFLQDGTPLEAFVDNKSGQAFEPGRTIVTDMFNIRISIAESMGLYDKKGALDISNIFIHGRNLDYFPVPGTFVQYSQGIIAKVDNYTITSYYGKTGPMYDPHPPGVFVPVWWQDIAVPISFVYNPTGKDFIKPAKDSINGLFNQEFKYLTVASWSMQNGQLFLNMSLTGATVDDKIISTVVDLTTGEVTIDKSIVDVVTNVREEVSNGLALNIDDVHVNSFYYAFSADPNLYNISVSGTDFSLTYDYNKGASGSYALTSMVNNKSGQDLYKNAVIFFKTKTGLQDVNLNSWQTNPEGIIAFNFKLQDGSIIEVDVDPETGIAMFGGDIITKVDAKIEEHNNNIVTVQNTKDKYDVYQKDFNNSAAEYDKLFASLPENSPFQHLGFAIPTLYVPVLEAIFKSNGAIATLEKAIRIGDLEKIRECLGVQISEVTQAIQGFTMFIDLYNKYSTQISEQIPQIKTYLEQYADLIKKAQAKIDEHKTNLTAVETRDYECNQNKNEFTSLYDGYNKLFAELPENNLFQHLDFVFPTLYVPIKEAIEKSHLEIDTLLKAIEQGDLATIKEHLGIEIPEAPQAIEGLDMFIKLYKDYSGKVVTEVSAIKTYLEQYADLIRKARAKIEEHNSNITNVQNTKDTYDSAKKGFNDLYSEYEKLFASLPPDNPFQHIGFEFPYIYPPVEDAINKSKTEIDILTKAIQEGDLETIKTHLDIQISEVKDAIQILTMFIGLYNKYSAQISGQIPLIRQYVEMWNAKQIAIKDLAARLRVSPDEIKVAGSPDDIISDSNGVFVVKLSHPLAVYLPLSMKTQGAITPQPYGTYTYYIRRTDYGEGSTNFIVDKVVYFNGSHDEYKYTPVESYQGTILALSTIDQYGKDGVRKATIHYGSQSNKIQSVSHYEIKDGVEKIKYVDEYKYGADGALTIVERYEGEVRIPEALPIAVSYYTGKAGLETIKEVIMPIKKGEQIRIVYTDGVPVIAYRDKLSLIDSSQSILPSKEIMRFSYERDENGNIIHTTVAYSNGTARRYDGLVDPVDVVIRFIGQSDKNRDFLSIIYKKKDPNEVTGKIRKPALVLDPELAERKTIEAEGEAQAGDKRFVDEMANTSNKEALQAQNNTAA